MKYFILILLLVAHLPAVNQVATDRLQRELAHLREIMDEREKQRIQHDQLTELAIDKAVIGIDARLENMNEFRGQQKDMIATLVRKEELANLVKELDELKEWKANSQGRNTIIMFLWPIAVALITFFINRYLKPEEKTVKI
jgi:hypothetical protein